MTCRAAFMQGLFLRLPHKFQGALHFGSISDRRPSVDLVMVLFRYLCEGMRRVVGGAVQRHIHSVRPVYW
jgi:hypothetical protein